MSHFIHAYIPLDGGTDSEKKLPGAFTCIGKKRFMQIKDCLVSTACTLWRAEGSDHRPLPCYMKKERVMDKKSFQEYYPEDYSHCYGCGTRNEHGLHISSYWDGEESVCSFTPREYHTAVPGYVYGGLIASLIDCHGTGTAAAAMYRREGRSMGSNPPLRFVTASLQVDFLKPTPIEGPLDLRTRITDISDRKVAMETDLTVHGILCARGRVVAVKLPDKMKAP